MNYKGFLQIRARPLLQVKMQHIHTHTHTKPCRRGRGGGNSNVGCFSATRRNCCHPSEKLGISPRQIHHHQRATVPFPSKEGPGSFVQRCFQAKLQPLLFRDPPFVPQRVMEQGALVSAHFSLSAAFVTPANSPLVPLVLNQPCKGSTAIFLGLRQFSGGHDAELLRPC